MKKFLLSSVAVLGLAGTATAADMSVKAPLVVPVAAAPSWAGFYVGANGGYGWGASNLNSDPFGDRILGGANAGQFPIPGGAFSPGLSGAVFGGQAGYNFQTANWVLGVEGDFDWAGLRASGGAVFPDPNLGAGGLATDGFLAEATVKWLASIRGRLGYTWGQGLFYLTGGGAWAKTSGSALISTDTLPAVFSVSRLVNFSATRSGWVIGAGYEYMINPNWIVRAEYLHYEFNGGTDTPVIFTPCNLGAAAVCGTNFRAGLDHVDAIRLGLSYKFNWGAFNWAAR